MLKEKKKRRGKKIMMTKINKRDLSYNKKHRRPNLASMIFLKYQKSHRMKKQ